jgi:hypothetical protein
MQVKIVTQFEEISIEDDGYFSIDKTNGWIVVQATSKAHVFKYPPTSIKYVEYIKGANLGFAGAL